MHRRGLCSKGLAQQAWAAKTLHIPWQGLVCAWLSVSSEPLARMFVFPGALGHAVSAWFLWGLEASSSLS
jgi:hypothetical protein